VITLNSPTHSENPYNLTRSLGFNAYQVLAANSSSDLQSSVDYLNDKYNTAYLIELLEETAGLIGARVLNISSERYDPLGSSVALLLADEGHPDHSRRLHTSALLGHLDKSHLTVHTYPQLHPDTGLCSLRLDLDLATCGTISPLATLPLLFSNITCDVVTIDFRIRGYQQSGTGSFDFGDSEVVSITEHLPAHSHEQFQITETNVPEILVYHTRMMRKTILPSDHMLASAEQKESVSTENLVKHLESLYTGK
jgi:S-adenosylmethionine decarboxylase